MILTGKAKAHFEKYVSELEIAPYVVMLEQMPDTYLNALIIEWFDSVGICVQIDVERFNDEYGFDSGFYYDNFNDYIAIDGFFESRQEATKEAIIKANEIYNQTVSLNARYNESL